MKYYIYIIKNIVNNKVYVGSTKSPYSRKISHFRNLLKNNHHSIYLQRSYNKYKKENFEFIVLSEFNDENRKENELLYINKYKSYLPQYGYNMWIPDDSKINFTCCQITKNKIKESHIKSGYSIPVVAYNIIDGSVIKEYMSLKECSLDLKIHIAIIHDIINKNKNRLSYKGMTFRKIGDIYDYKPSSKQRFMFNNNFS